MSDFTIYDAATGELLRTAQLPDSFDIQGHISENEVAVDGVQPFDTYRTETGIATMPPRPSNCHDWDWTTKTWKPNIANALANKSAAVSQEFAIRTLQPVQYDGAPFDADEVARGRIIATITRMIRGDGLPAGWVGWRDYDNAMHWGEDTTETVRAQLAGLSAAIEDREQSLLVAAWQHKAALAALTTVEDIIAYDVTTGWPS